MYFTAFLYAEKIESEDGNYYTGPDERTYFFAEKEREDGNEKDIESCDEGCLSWFCSSVDTELL